MSVPEDSAGLRLDVARERYVRWLAVAKELSIHTLRAYECDIAALQRHLGAGASVCELERDSVVAFIEGQRLAGLSPASIRRRAAALRGFCAWLVSNELLDSDPWAGTTVLAGRSRKLPRTLAARESERLMRFLRTAAGADGRDDAVDALRRPHESTTLLAVALMLTTGVRVHEVVGIACKDIDLSSRALRLVGKGRRERRVFLSNDWIAGLVHDYLVARGELGVGHSRLLFNCRFEPLSEPAMRSRLAKAARAAGLQAHVTPHMLRHTAATQLIEAGVDIRYIQRLLGHASLSTTEIYTHVSDNALKRVVTDADILGRLAQGR